MNTTKPNIDLSKEIAWIDYPGPELQAFPPIHGFATAISIYSNGENLAFWHCPEGKDFNIRLYLVLTPSPRKGGILSISCWAYYISRWLMDVSRTPHFLHLPKDGITLESKSSRDNK